MQSRLVDQLWQEYEKPEDLLGGDGLLHQLTKALVERTLEGELTHHLGYKKHEIYSPNTIDPDGDVILLERYYRSITSEDFMRDCIAATWGFDGSNITKVLEGVV